MGSLREGWLSVELNEIKNDVKEWSQGIRESYESHFTQSTADRSHTTVVTSPPNDQSARGRPR
jgi:hypothetical protein